MHGKPDVLVTGATGYLGASLVPALVGDARVGSVRILARQEDPDLGPLVGLPPSSVGAAIADLHDTSSLGLALEGVDTVIHLAAEGNPSTSVGKEAAVRHVNIGGLACLLEAARKTEVRRIIFPSTLSFFAPADGVAREDAPASDVRPSNPYAHTKWEGEGMLAAAGQEWGLQPTVLRMGSVYGPSPRMCYRNVVNRFLLLALLGKPVPVWKGADAQIRPYLDIEDAAVAFGTVLHAAASSGTAFHVRTHDLTLKDVCDALGRELPSLRVETRTAPIPLGPGFVTESRRLEALGFRASGSLERGLRGLRTALAALRPR